MELKGDKSASGQASETFLGTLIDTVHLNITFKPNVSYREEAYSEGLLLH